MKHILLLFSKNQQFSFQQDRGLIYFGVSVIDEYESQPLNSVSLLWYGSSKQNSPVMLNLLDDGTKGDILEGDGLYSISVLNDEDSIIHVIGQNSEQDTSIQKTKGACLSSTASNSTQYRAKKIGIGNNIGKHPPKGFAPSFL